jgi:hypothetical protein
MPVALIAEAIRAGARGGLLIVVLAGVGFLGGLGYCFWIELVWTPARRIRQFRYSRRVLAYRTSRDGWCSLPLTEVGRVYRRVRRHSFYGWAIRRPEGGWLILDMETENGQGLIDLMCRDRGWDELAESPV